MNLYGDGRNLYINMRDGEFIAFKDPTIIYAQFYANGSKVLVGKDNSIELYAVGRDNLYHEITLIAISSPMHLDQLYCRQNDIYGGLVYAKTDKDRSNQT